MAAFRMCGVALKDVAGTDAFSRYPYRKVLTHNRVSKVGRVSTSQRVLRVLVVDDDQDTTEELVRLVRRWGHTVQLTFNGLAALRVAAAQEPDVVLLDIEIPLMDGCQVAKHLRLIFPKKECLIIGVAGRADDVRRQQCIEAGIDLLLIKPLDPAVMETLLMLECVRVNRPQADNPAGIRWANPETSPVLSS